MDALVHPYIDEGRLRYHSCMCKCCFTVPLTGLRHFCMDYEPVAPQTFDDKWEKKMSNVQQVKGTRARQCGCARRSVRTDANRLNILFFLVGVSNVNEFTYNRQL